MTSTDYTNTSFAIQNDAERHFWITFHVFVLLSSLLGDSLILFASFQRDAFKLNSFIVVVIQYIAVFDIAFSIFCITPRTLSLIANSDVLKDALCYTQEYLTISTAIAMAWLTPVLTTSKFLLIKYPFRSGNWIENKRAHIACWFSLLPSVLATLTKPLVELN